MKKFTQNIFLFIFFASVFYLCTLFIFGSYPTLRHRVPNIKYRLGGYTYTRLNEVKNIDSSIDNIDILFLGSSHSYRGFDTRIFKKEGLSTFNLGSSAQTPIQTQVLLKRYLDRLQPKLIIYEVYPVTLSIDGVESSFQVISNDKNDLYSYDMAFNLNHIAVYNTLFYATIRDIFKLNNSYNNKSIKVGVDTYVTGGYVEREMKYYEPQIFPKNKIAIRESQLESFEQIINIIKEKEIDLLLVYAPITKGLYLSYTNNKYFDSIMTTYADYYNFNEIMNLEDSLCFYDSHHLNQKGVELFNEKLLNILIPNRNPKN